MKNETVPTGNYFFNNTTLRKCERFLFSLWHSFLLYQQWDALIQLKNWRPMVALRIYLLGLVASPTLQKNAVTSIKEFWSNPRFRIGVGIACVALPFWRAHTFFDINARIEGFYYVNLAFYFNTIRAYVCGLFISVGAFIAMPQKWAFKWFAVPIAVFCATEIYLESFYDHWTDFYQSMPGWQVWAIIMCSVPAFFFSMDYLCYRKYHLKDGNLGRVDGILQLKNLDAETKVQKLDEMIEERKNYNARV